MKRADGPRCRSGLLPNRLQVVDIAVSGDMDPFALEQVTERVRDELTAVPGIVPRRVRPGLRRRFQLIFAAGLTSLTTFFGLAPLMWNQSLDATFMVPMAVSLGFGVLFATVITLVLVPTACMILDDAGRALRGVFGRPVVADAA